jgi:transcriptional regulator with XRE-family HTH domain
MYMSYVEVDAKKVRALRRKRVLTLRELGEKAGVSKDTISRIEREGTAYPATIRKLAKALDVDPSALVPGEEE